MAPQQICQEDHPPKFTNRGNKGTKGNHEEDGKLYIGEWCLTTVNCTLYTAGIFFIVAIRQGKANLFIEHNSYTRQFKVLYSYIKSEEGK